MNMSLLLLELACAIVLLSLLLLPGLVARCSRNTDGSAAAQTIAGQNTVRRQPGGGR